MHYHICDVCREAGTNDQIKSGCGHLTYICDDCRDEQNAVAHDKCITCKGGKTGDALFHEENERSNAYISSLMQDLFEDELLQEEEQYIDAQETYEERYGGYDDYMYD